MDGARSPDQVRIRDATDTDVGAMTAIYDGFLRIQGKKAGPLVGLQPKISR